MKLKNIIKDKIDQRKYSINVKLVCIISYLDYSLFWHKEIRCIFPILSLSLSRSWYVVFVNIPLLSDLFLFIYSPFFCVRYICSIKDRSIKIEGIIMMILPAYVSLVGIMNNIDLLIQTMNDMSFVFIFAWFSYDMILIKIIT